MNSDVFVKAITAIESIFGNGKYPTNAADDIWPDIKDEPDDAMRGAYKRIRIEFNTRPTLARVRELILDEGKKIRLAQGDSLESDAALYRREAQRDANVLTVPMPDGMLQEATRGLGLFQNGFLTCRQWIEKLLDLDTRYPGVGWATQARDMQSKFINKGMNLDGYCGQPYWMKR